MRSVLGGAAALAVAVGGAAPASAAVVRERFTASDGVQLQTTLTSADPAARRPTVVELTPYGRSGASFTPAAPYNHLLVEARGTGDSGGRFDAFGPRMQRDLAEVLGWACDRPWSNRRLGLSGFSASAIAVYNSLHLELPCVEAAVLKSGTFELYRDLLTPGGVSNVVPGAVVLAGIGAIAASQAGTRDPATTSDALSGSFGTGLEVLRRPSLDAWWRERGFRGDVNHLPVLVINGFFDVESRGAFEAYQALRADGAHLHVIGAHDARPAGTDGGVGKVHAWFDHHLRDVDNGVDREPRVQLWMSDGDRRTYAQGRFVRRDATDWPVPGTRWTSLRLDATRSGTARSGNDGTLTAGAPAKSARQSYATLPTVPTMTDVPNAAIVDGSGGSALTDALPVLADMSVAEPLGLTYTTAPLVEDVVSAGPGSLEVTLSTTTPGTPIWAVVSDVGPDGTPHPLTVGRLSTDFPAIDPVRSRRDPVSGDVVQPFGRYDLRRPALPLSARRYHVELWPLGNRFRAGHRIRLHLVGPSLASRPSVPGITTVTIGGPHPSRLLLPVLPATTGAGR